MTVFLTTFGLIGAERLRAAATQALRILERTGLAPITAALLRAALVGFCRGLPLTERARCRT